MSNPLLPLTATLKRILAQYKTNQQPLSFLLFVGKEQQGKSTLLKQSSLIRAELSSESAAEVYYNAHGMILDLDEHWINEHNMLLQHVLKEINRCHHRFKINGLLLALDMNLLYDKHPDELAQTIQIQNNLLKRVGQALDYRIHTSIILTKLDGIAGFSDFFEQEYVHEQQKPLGFSLNWGLRNGKLAHDYRKHFDQFIQSLEQSILQKIHPIRSNLKRKLIREFPLQLMQLRSPIHSLLNALPTHPCRVRAIYFTSAKQGGISIDYLNHKIQQEYAFIVRDQFPQATNHRAYFIEGALTTTQAFTQQAATTPSKISPWHLMMLSGVLALCCLVISTHYFSTRHTLDKVSRELLAYELNNTKTDQKTQALFHLTQASALLQQTNSILPLPPSMQMLNTNIQHRSILELQHAFIPMLLSALEQPLLSRQAPPAELYQTLKVYLLLGEPRLGQTDDITTWFSEYWQTHYPSTEQAQLMRLLQDVLREPRQTLPINQALINNVRHYLNALPSAYLYYSIAKQQLNQQIHPLHFPGLILAKQQVPHRLTKLGFKQTIGRIPALSKTLQTEHWVLQRDDLDSLETAILDSYCYEYTL